MKKKKRDEIIMTIAYENNWWLRVAEKVANIGKVAKGNLQSLTKQQNSTVINSKCLEEKNKINSSKLKAYLNQPLYTNSNSTKGDFWNGFSSIILSLGIAVVGISIMARMVEKLTKKYVIYELDKIPALKSKLVSKGFPEQLISQINYLEINPKYKDKIINDFINDFIERENISHRNKRIYRRLRLRDYVDYELAWISKQHGFLLVSRNYRDFSEFFDKEIEKQNSVYKEKLRKNGQYNKDLWEKIDRKSNPNQIGAIKALIPKFRHVTPEKYPIDTNLNPVHDLHISGTRCIDSLGKGKSLLIDNQILINGPRIEPNHVLFEKLINKECRIIITETVKEEYFNQQEQFIRNLANRIAIRLIDEKEIDQKEIKTIRNHKGYIQDIEW